MFLGDVININIFSYRVLILICINFQETIAITPYRPLISLPTSINKILYSSSLYRFTIQKIINHLEEFNSLWNIQRYYLWFNDDSNVFLKIQKYSWRLRRFKIFLKIVDCNFDLYHIWIVNLLFLFILNTRIVLTERTILFLWIIDSLHKKIDIKLVTNFFSILNNFYNYFIFTNI